ncbi:amino-acid N-acetyltransferase [Rhodobacter viridis]|uniref:Amino-acid N-acetyltransferase n=1 Tax=Rhodobacter viridis TaxID=1054202 RepID=A0A318TQP9_9RHOB|nr:arsenic resistance N-acetyltransferase ArsN2 [Rhodobacter viridis]PYF07166.1 amino-acid N-acetyltransferase [Rhodobacter viridis]
MPEVMVLPELTAKPIPGADPGLVEALTAARLPTEDLADPGRNFLAFTDASGAICGYGGYEMLDGHALIRSMVVAEPARGHGIGSAMLTTLLATVAAAGASDAWLFTKHAAQFFSHRGFRARARYEVPPPVLASKQASSVCPITAVVMSRALPA